MISLTLKQGIEDFDHEDESSAEDEERDDEEEESDLPVGPLVERPQVEEELAGLRLGGLRGQEGQQAQPEELLLHGIDGAVLLEERAVAALVLRPQLQHGRVQLDDDVDQRVRDHREDLDLAGRGVPVAAEHDVRQTARQSLEQVRCHLKR